LDNHDAASDGLPNLVKYALSLNPLIPAGSGRPTSTTTNGFLTLTFTRRKDATDITYHVEGTGSLGTNWSELYTSTSTAYEGGENATSAVTVFDTIPLSIAPDGRRFMRLKITRP
jgi:hypothetical protein